MTFTYIDGNSQTILSTINTYFFDTTHNTELSTNHPISNKKAREFLGTVDTFCNEKYRNN